MRTAILFSGQGAQKVGMGRDLTETWPVAAEMFREADAILGRGLSEVMFGGPAEELTRTMNCQPALYVHGLACLAALREELGGGLGFEAAAGLSLGEFTAHAAAGTFSFADGLRLVAERGRLMEEACAATAGTMAAMIGGEEEGAAALAASCGVDVANLNAPGQTVLSGSKEGIAAAVGRAKEFGFRKAVPLAVAGAYHSRLMESARKGLEGALAGTAMGVPGVTVVANVTALPAGTAEEVRGTLARQVTGSVRWAPSMRWLLAEGFTRFIELGPDATLAGLMGRIEKGVEVISAGDVAGVRAAAERLKAEG